MKEEPNVLNRVAEDFADADLGDERLNQRLRSVASLLAAQPNASLPQALSPADLKAAYRLFGNEDVEVQALLASHLALTDRRCRQVPLVLAVQDTTELDYTAHRATRGLGYLNDLQHRGLLLHTAIAFTPEGVPLGLLGQEMWVRDDADFGKRAKRKQLPITQKESYKWLRGLQSTLLAAQSAPHSHFIAVADREADIYEFFAAPRAANCDLLVRACRIRNLSDGEHLAEYVAAQEVVAEVTVQVPKHEQQPARKATLQIRYAKVQLRPSNPQQAPLELYAVLASEPDPPAGAKAVRWLLLTSCVVDSLAQALQVLHWYSVRWGIEVWHKVLKSGCNVEHKQLAEFSHLARMISVYSIIALRIHYATMLARAVPEISCEVVLERSEWQALCCVILQVAQPPAEPPSLAQALRWVAQLGGFIGRKSDGEPGVTTLWRGWQRLHDLTMMYNIVHPPSDVGND